MPSDLHQLMKIIGGREAQKKKNIWCQEATSLQQEVLSKWMSLRTLRQQKGDSQRVLHKFGRQKASHKFGKQEMAKQGMAAKQTNKPVTTPWSDSSQNSMWQWQLCNCKGKPQTKCLGVLRKFQFVTKTPCSSPTVWKQFQTCMFWKSDKLQTSFWSTHALTCSQQLQNTMHNNKSSQITKSKDACANAEP